MKLYVKDRLLFQQLYPKESDLSTQILVRDIRNKVDIKQEDIEKYGVRSEGRAFQWNSEKDKGEEIEFSNAEIQLLKEQVRLLDQQKKVTPEILDLCLKIKEA